MNNEQIAIINDYNEKMWEEEDEYLETWLTYGCPDGETADDLKSYYSTEDFNEWVELAENLLKKREENA